jgi:hypothetical protein
MAVAMIAGAALMVARPQQPVPPAERLVFPVWGPTSYIDSFGTPRLAGTPDAHVNTGVDVYATGDAAVAAVAAGRITATGVDRRQMYGRFFVLETRSGDRYRYAGVSSNVPLGREVATGEPLTSVALTIAGNRPRLFLERSVRVGGSWRPVNVYQQLRRAEGRAVGRIETRRVHGIEVAADVAASLEALLAGAEQAGFVLSGAGYRSPAEVGRLRRAACGPTQADVVSKPAEQCRPPVDRPGESPLETGRAVDLRIVPFGGTAAGRRLRRTDRAFAWLLVNGERSGWVNPSAAAPWRWEFAAGRLG